MALMVDDPKTILVLDQKVDLTPVYRAVRKFSFKSKLDFVDLPVVHLVMPEIRLHQPRHLSGEISHGLFLLVEEISELKSQLVMLLFPVFALVIGLEKRVNPSPSTERFTKYLRLQSLYVL